MYSPKICLAGRVKMEELSHIQQMVSLFVRFIPLDGRFCVYEKKTQRRDSGAFSGTQVVLEQE